MCPRRIAGLCIYEQRRMWKTYLVRILPTNLMPLLREFAVWNRHLRETLIEHYPLQYISRAVLKTR